MNKKNLEKEIVPANFSNSWTIEDTKKMNDMLVEASSMHSKSAMEFLDFDNLELKILGHLLYLKQNNLLPELPDVYDLEFNMDSNFRLFLKGDFSADYIGLAVHYMKEVASNICDFHLLNSISKFKLSYLENFEGKPNFKEEKFVNALHDFLLKEVNGGNFKLFPKDGECYSSGKKIAFKEFKNWIPQYKIVNLEGKSFQFLKENPGSCYEDITEETATFKKEVLHFVSDCPSGKLLLADWFRIEGFTQFFDEKYHLFGNKISLNSIKGLIERSKMCNEIGFNSFSVGNSSPEIYKKDGIFVFGFSENESSKSINCISTDLWWVSAIDKDFLAKSVSDWRKSNNYKNPSVEEVKNEIEEMVERKEIFSLDVSSGKMHFYFSQEYDFKDKIKSEFGEPLEEFSEIRIIASEKELIFDMNIKNISSKNKTRTNKMKM